MIGFRFELRVGAVENMAGGGTLSTIERLKQLEAVEGDVVSAIQSAGNETQCCNLKPTNKFFQLHDVIM